MKRKHITFIIILLLIVNFTGISQGLRIDTMYIIHNGQKVMALKSDIEPNYNFVKKNSNEFFTQNFKLSLKGKNELVAKEVRIPEISTKRMDYYILIESNNFGSTVYNFSRLGYDIYIDTLDFKREFNGMNIIFSDYVSYLLSTFYKQEIKNISEEIDKLNEEKKQLNGEIKQLDKKIIKNQKALNKLTITDDLNAEEARVQEVEQMELQSKINDYTNQKQYNKQKLETLNGNLKNLAGDLEKINLKLQQLTSAATIP